MDVRAELTGRLEEAGVEAALIEQLAAYGAFLLEANQQFNLTGAKTPEELVPHLLDSLSVVPFARGALVDIGSGGGLPAIPIGIVTKRPIFLIESVAKKAVFLRKALGELGLQGEVWILRAEAAGHDPALREQFDTATARAVSSAPTVAELLMPFLAIGGRAILQRGNLEEREREALSDAALMLGGRVAEEHRLEGERRIVIIEKVEPTNHRFPRRAGVPEKRPLCSP